MQVIELCWNLLVSTLQCYIVSFDRFHGGQEALVPKLKLSLSDANLPFILQRIQFPLCLCYSIFLSHFFSHGQLSVVFKSKNIACGEGAGSRRMWCTKLFCYINIFCYWTNMVLAEKLKTYSLLFSLEIRQSYASLITIPFPTYMSGHCLVIPAALCCAGDLFYRTIKNCLSFFLDSSDILGH